jgi:hypothetical protein
MNSRIAAVAALSIAMLAFVPGVGGWEANQTLERFAKEEGRSPGRAPARRTNADDSAEIAKLIDDINAAARANKQRMLSIITINTDVAGTTLEQQKAQTGFSFGEIYVAHSLALATHKKFDAIAKLKKSGKTWVQIAREHNVALKGSRELIRQMREKK